MQKTELVNDAILRRFATLKQNGRLAHAYLFTGPLQIGKSETALAVAKLMNCEAPRDGEFCDTCPACAKINSGNHPDVFMIDPQPGESIKIEQVRELLSRNKLRSFMAHKKVFILKNAENLTLEAANAFLKTLEEPTADSLIILTTTSPERNLDTIRSRCHHVTFPLMPDRDVDQRLREQGGLDDRQAHVIAYFAQGCLGTARQLKEERFDLRKNELIDAFILNRPAEGQIKEMLADKESTKELIDIMLSWVRDCLLVKAAVADERVIHLDRIDDLKSFIKQYSFEELSDLNGAIVRMGQLLAENLNIKLPLLIIGEQLWQR